MNAEEIERKLLVKSVLEALLAKEPARRDPDERDRRLKAATLLECAEKGYVDLTIARVARRCQMSTATIYERYPDREALLVAAIEMLLSILAQDVIEEPAIKDPLQRVEVLLFTHGMVYAQPFATWLFRLYVTLTWFENRPLRRIGEGVFARIDAFWEALLRRLVEAGDLAALDAKLVTPLLLGPIERWTLVSHMSCGERPRPEAELAELARHSARALFALWGTEKFWAGQSAPRPRVGRVEPPMLSLPPETGAAQTLTQRHVASLLPARGNSTEIRHERMLLAAALECEERGYGKASVAEVAARACVSLATLYKQFGDKEGLYHQVAAMELGAPTDNPDADDAPSFGAASLVPRLLASALAEIAPHRAWLLNFSMASKLSAAPAMIAINRARRETVEARWEKGLAAIAPTTMAQPKERTLALNFLLGGVERAGALSALLFGRQAVDERHLLRVAQASAQAWLSLYGEA